MRGFERQTNYQEKLIHARSDARLRRELKFEKFIKNSPEFLSSFFNRVPNRFKKIWYDAYIGIGGAKNAIKAKCLDCKKFSYKKIAICNKALCPLWQVRPFQKNENEDGR